MLDKNIAKVNYKTNGSTVLHTECIDINVFNKLVNDFNNINNNHKILENKFVEVYNENNELYDENQQLKCEIEKLKTQINEMKNDIINNESFINDDLMYVDFDIFQYDNNNDTKKQINYYEKQIDTLNTIFKDNNINNITELKIKISSSGLDYNYLSKKYDNINAFLDSANINSKSQNVKINELYNKYKNFNDRVKIIKDKIEALPIGTVLVINGIKKVYRGKIEKHIYKIKMVEDEFNDYLQHQINWAKSIISNNIISDKEIITLLDVYNKLTKEYSSGNSSDDEISNIFNKIESNKLNDYILLSELGKEFIKNDITDKSQIQDIIKNYKKVIYCYDSKDKINRFISTCKRLYALSQKIKVDNIMKSKCQTRIRDMTNTEFDNLLKLIENKNK